MNELKNSVVLPHLITYAFKHEDELLKHPLHASVVILRLLGRLPLSMKSGRFSFKINSWWMFYCFLSVTVQFVFALAVLRTSFTSKRGWSGFDSTIQTLMNLSLLTTVPQSILLTWRKSGNIASAINQWKTFQKTFQEVTRRSISSFPLEHPNWTVFLIAFCSSLTDFIPATISYQRTVKDQFKIHVFVVYGATVLYVKMILAIWLMHTHSVSLAAKLLKDSLVEMLAGDPTVIKLRLHRSLWVELHNYTCAVTAAVGNTVRAWLMTNILTASLSVYATGISFTNNEPLKVSTYTPIITCALPVFLINNASFMADDQIGNNFIVKLLSFNYHQFSDSQLEEVELFLFTIENSSDRFLLDGMVEISRTTVLDIVETALTLMVVLLQLRVST